MTLTQTSQFKKDVKRQRKRGKDVSKLKEVIEALVSGSELPERFRDHALAGNWKGWRDCHVEPDWLLIYKTADEELILGRTGSHADLF
ncbi:MAG: type II toxin-antitoxin system YafQ family toxin [Verrucomicrobiota bacterium]